MDRLSLHEEEGEGLSTASNIGTPDLHPLPLLKGRGGKPRL